MQNLGLVLLVFGFVCATIACFGFAEPFRLRLVAAAFAFLLAAMIFGGVQAAHIFGR